jgi:uncharacterized protein YcbK (DUF882 family)
MTEPRPPARRNFLRRGAAALIGAPMLLPAARASALPSTGAARELTLRHTHTNESIALAYASGDHYDPGALQALNHFLRDHYTGEVGVIDPQVFELLHRVRQVLGSTAAYEVISGYRGAATNSLLRATRGGGVASKSLHMEGRAIDVRLPGVALADLRDAAMSLRAGGVGYYPGERFVHIDTGRVRHW